MPQWLQKIGQTVTIGTIISLAAMFYPQWSARETQKQTNLRQLVDSSEKLQVISEQLRQPCTTTDCQRRFNDLWAAFASNHYEFVHAATFIVADETARADIDLIDDFYNPSKQIEGESGGKTQYGTFSDFGVLPVQEAVLRARDALESRFVDSTWCTDDRRADMRSLTESVDVYRHCRGKIRDFAEKQMDPHGSFFRRTSFKTCRVDDAKASTARVMTKIRDAKIRSLDDADYSAPWLFDAYCAAAGLRIGGGVVPPRTKQLLVVTTDSWESAKGSLVAYERTDKEKWSPAKHAPIPVVLGKNGLGWARGLLPIPMIMDSSGPFKREGDGRAPAGLFPLGAVYSDPTAAQLKIKMPTVTTDEAMYCDDRVGSPAYNQRIRLSSDELKACSNSEAGCPGEPLLRPQDGIYKRFIWVKYNSDPVVKSAGSCIFLHLNHDDMSPTVGCTTVSVDDMDWLLHWLDQSQHPLLLQLPRDALVERRAQLQIPGF